MLNRLVILFVLFFLAIYSPVLFSKEDIVVKTDIGYVYLWNCRPDSCAVFIKPDNSKDVSFFTVPKAIEKEIFTRHFKKTYKCM